MITDDPDTNSRPSNPPSSRPMTLRQQLALDDIFEDFSIRFVEYVKNGNNAQDALYTAWQYAANNIEGYGQELAREAVNDLFSKLPATVELRKNLYQLDDENPGNNNTHFGYTATYRHIEDDKYSSGVPKVTTYKVRKHNPFEALEGLIAELTQKPPQPLADMHDEG